MASWNLSIDTCPRVTIITVTYEATAFVSRYIAAIRAQTFADWECLIIDDGSPDATLSALHACIASDTRFRVFARPHAGHPAPNRQFALERARGELIALCDQDDFWLPQKLELQLRAFTRYPDAVLCHTDRLVSEELAPDIPVVAGGDTVYVLDSCERALFERCAITCSSVMAPRSQVRAVGGFCEQLKGVDDYHLWLRLCTRGPIVWLKQPLLHYTLHDSNMSASPSVMARGLTDMALALERDAAPPIISRVARAQACKARAVASWTEHPWRTVRLLLQSFLARPSARTAQLLLVSAASCLLTVAQRRRQWRRIVVKRRRSMLEPRGSAEGT